MSRDQWTHFIVIPRYSFEETLADAPCAFDWWEVANYASTEYGNTGKKRIPPWPANKWSRAGEWGDGPGEDPSFGAREKWYASVRNKDCLQKRYESEVEDTPRHWWTGPDAKTYHLRIVAFACSGRRDCPSRGWAQIIDWKADPWEVVIANRKLRLDRCPPDLERDRLEPDWRLDPFVGNVKDPPYWWKL